MAAIYNNPKGFLIVEGNLTEFVDKCHFGIKNGLVVCDECNNILKKDIRTDKKTGKVYDVSKYYYVAVLNMLFCKECCEHFVANSIRYDDDIPIEERNFKNVCHALGLEMPEN